MRPSGEREQKADEHEAPHDPTMARYRLGGMRSLVAPLVLAGALLSGCVCASLPSNDDTEAAARGALTRDRMTNIELVRVDQRTFDFTSTRGETQCEGTIVVNRHEGTTTSAIRSSCE